MRIRYWIPAAAILAISKPAAADCETLCASVEQACIYGPALLAAAEAGPAVLAGAALIAVSEYVISELCNDKCYSNCSGAGCAKVCEFAEKKCDALTTVGAAVLNGADIPGELIEMTIGWITGPICSKTCDKICSEFVPEAGGSLCSVAESGDGVCGFPEYGNACAEQDKDCCGPGLCVVGKWCVPGQGVAPYGVCGACDGCSSIVCKSYSECSKSHNVSLCDTYCNSQPPAGISAGG